MLVADRRVKQPEAFVASAYCTTFNFTNQNVAITFIPFRKIMKGETLSTEFKNFQAAETGTLNPGAQENYCSN